MKDFSEDEGECVCVCVWSVHEKDTLSPPQHHGNCKPDCSWVGSGQPGLGGPASLSPEDHPTAAGEPTSAGGPFPRMAGPWGRTFQGLQGSAWLPASSLACHQPHPPPSTHTTGKETQPQVGAGAGWVIQPSPPDALTPGLLHPVGGTALVFTGVHIQRLDGWLTLGI